MIDQDEAGDLRAQEMNFNEQLDAMWEKDNRIMELETELAAYQEREQWIHDNATTNGGGNGFTVTFFVPVDHEDIFCGISAAIKEQQ